VEDDALAARLIEAMFARKGDARVVVCGTAEEGMKLLAGAARTPRPELILTDLSLPGMNGLDFIRAVRRSTQHRSLPIVAITASTDENNRRESLDAGANAFFTKAQISANINEWVSQIVHLASAHRKAA
jgi:CheY-like chemotaxis protein